MNKQLSISVTRDLMSMPSARAREPQARPRRVLISLYFVSLELTAALGLPFALGPTLSDGGVASCSGLLHVPVSHVLLFLVDVDLAIDSS